MRTSSRPCLFHCSAMYRASSLLRGEPAMCGSAVKIRCCLRSSAAEGMALNFCSTAVSCAAAPALNPRMACGAEGGDARVAKKQNAGNMTAVRERNEFMPFLPELENRAFRESRIIDAGQVGATGICRDFTAGREEAGADPARAHAARPRSCRVARKHPPGINALRATGVQPQLLPADWAALRAGDLAEKGCGPAAGWRDSGED